MSGCGQPFTQHSGAHTMEVTQHSGAHTMEVTQHSGAHTMEIMSSYIIDCHEKDRASSRAARKAFKGVQTSTASGDATCILLRKSTENISAWWSRQAARWSECAESSLHFLAGAVRAFSCSIPTRFTRDATRLNFLSGRPQRRLDTITCDGNYYGLIAFHNTVKGVMYGESGFV